MFDFLRLLAEAEGQAVIIDGLNRILLLLRAAMILGVLLTLYYSIIALALLQYQRRLRRQVSRLGHALERMEASLDRAPDRRDPFDSRLTDRHDPPGIAP